MLVNYNTICKEVLKDLPERTRNILIGRFGLSGQEPQTLEAIGKRYGNITRERVRQIEASGLKEARKNAKDRAQKAFNGFSSYLKSNKGLKREDVLLSHFGGAKHGNHAFFLLSLAGRFQRFGSTADCHSFWCLDKNAATKALKNTNSFIDLLQNKKKPCDPPASVPLSHVEISKQILKSPEGLYGLKSWPEINPRNMRDKSFLALRSANKPLHFREVASRISSANAQTVHNELIKDARFVLVGRGIYALQEWGYVAGNVKDIILNVLHEAKKPLSREEVLQMVLRQRQVKAATVLLNLQNKNHFRKQASGKYAVRTA